MKGLAITVLQEFPHEAVLPNRFGTGQIERAVQRLREGHIGHDERKKVINSRSSCQRQLPLTASSTWHLARAFAFISRSISA